MAASAAEDRLVTVEINKGEMVRLDRPASSIVISDPATADVQVVSPKLIFVRGKKIGETSFYAIDAEDHTILSATVNVTHNISSLERTIKRVAPDADVGFKTVDGGMVMDGYTGTAAESETIRSLAATFVGKDEKLVNMIKTGGSDQVMLKVKIVEMARSDLKKMGVNLQNVTNNGPFSLQVLQGSSNMPFFGPDPDTLYYRTPGSLLNRQSNVDTNIFLRYNNLFGLIDMLETQGLATVLAEPSLSTTSGQAASFLAGGQFPIPAAGQNGTVTIEYKPFGVSLNFTPVVMNKDRISMTVAPEVSTLNFSNPIQVSNITYPILNTRKASATIELGSGDSFMLAGLMQNDGNTNVQKFPGLGDLPILGAMFRSTSFQNNQTELVILVTPYIVHPVSEANKLQTPMDGYKPPSDLQVLLLGNLYQQEPLEDDEEAPELPKLHGEGGFMTDDQPTSDEPQP